MRYLAFLLFILVPILGVYTFVKAPEWGLWFPENYSTFGPGIDFLFYVILVPILITFLGTELVLAWCVLKFSSPKLAGKSWFTHGSHKLEMIWTAIPAGMLVILAFWQMGSWAEMKFPKNFPGDAPEDEYSLENPIAEVWASQFDWRVIYPDAEGNLDGVDRIEVPFEFTVPVDTRVVFNLRSQDVLHSFFVPVFRLKQDAVPGMTIPVWFEATETGSFDLICAELCGWGHYKMAGRVTVLEKDEYDAWLAGMRAQNYSGGGDE